MTKVFFLVFFFFYGCQSIFFETPSHKIPNEYKTFFRSCENKEGFGEIKVRFNNKPKLLSQIEWVILNSYVYDIFLLDPLGFEFLSLKSDYNSFNINSSHSLLNNKIDIDPDGFILINNFWLGLRHSELSCFLSGNLPIEWKNNLVTLVSENNLDTIFLKEKKRNITITFNKDNQSSIRKICTRFKWNIFWPLKNGDLSICIDFLSFKKILLRFNDKIIIDINHL